jgi:hypothetical protein
MGRLPFFGRTPDPVDGWDGVRYSPAEPRNHVESFFLKATSPEALRAVWIKATILARASEPGAAVAEGWAVTFDHRAERRSVAVKHQLPLTEARFGRETLDVGWSLPAGGGHLRLGADATAGRLCGETHRIEWDLAFAGEARPFVPLPHRALYDARVPTFKTVTPRPDLRFSGRVEVDGDRWQLDGWRGMQGHNWGRSHTEQYAWCHCNQWEGGEDLVLEAGSGRVRIGRALLPPLTFVCVRRGGDDHLFRAPLELLSARADLGLRSYAFSARGAGGRVWGVVEAATEDFVGLRYLNPSGAPTYCLNTKLARARLRFEQRGECLELASRAAALEIGTRRDDHGIEVRA